MTGTERVRRASGVARLVRRRVWISAVTGLFPAVTALALAPGPPAYGARWLSGLLPRFTDLAPDVIAAAAALLALLTLVSTLWMKGAAALKLLVLLLVGETVVAVARMLNGGGLGGCVVGPCASIVGDMGSAAVVWVCALLTGVVCWVTVSQFRGARSSL